MTTKKRKSVNNKFLFTDADVFIDAIKGNAGKEILSLIKAELDNDKLILIIPEIIKSEIDYVFNNYRAEFFDQITDYLATRNILRIKDQLTNSKSIEVSQKEKLDNSRVKLIDALIADSRVELVDKIKSYYNSIYDEIALLLTHKNTKIIPLFPRVIINGLKRSLLKLAPYTNKTTESAHVKDSDCVAFESLIYFIETKNVKRDDTLIMCVREKDYLNDNSNLKGDILESLKKVRNIILCSDLQNLLNIENGKVSENILLPENIQNTVEPSLAIPSDQSETSIESPNIK